MITNIDTNLSEALTRFANAQKSRKLQGGHQELSRFVAWCGRTRKVSELSPAEVADYGQYAGLGSADSTKRLAPVKEFLAFLKEEGLVETPLAPHLRAPRGRKLAGTSTTRPAPDTTSITQETYDKLVTQLESLKQGRVSVVDDIRRAMADKDFRENAPLEAAKEQQGFIESKIRELESALANSQIRLPGPVARLRRVTVGASVTLREKSSGAKVVYTLVDMREANAASGKISTQSPVGQALLDRTIGDEVTVNVPKGRLHYIVEGLGA